MPTRPKLRAIFPDTVTERQKEYLAYVTREELLEAGIYIDSKTKGFYLDAKNYKIYWMAKYKREQELAKKDNDDSKIVDIKEGKRH